MSYENIRFTKPNMAIVDGYFYTLDESRNALIVKVADGDSAFHYPTDTPVGAQVKSLQYDGHYLWSMQDDSNGFLIKRWELENYICKLKDTFTYHDTSFINYQSSAFGVEHYITDFSQTLTSRNDVINISEYYDSVLVSGTILTLGPNTLGNWEHVTVSGVIGSDVYLTDRVRYLYSEGDKVCTTRSLFVFNDYQGTSSSKGTLFRFDAYTGNYISSAYDVEYQNITAATFSRVQNALSNHPDAHTLIYIKGTNAKLRNMSDLINILDASSGNDLFDGPSIDTQKWNTLYGNPSIDNSQLFMSCTPGTTDELKSNYYLLGDFDLQISGSLNEGYTNSSGIYPNYIDHYLKLYTVGSSNWYKLNILYANQVIPSGNLELEYTMDSYSGSTIYDTSGNGRNGTNYGSVVVASQVGEGRYFDGNDYIDMPDISLQNTSFTIAAWINPLVYSSFAAWLGSSVSSSVRPPTIYNYQVTSSTGSLHFGFGNGSWVSYLVTNVFNNGANNWYHIAWVLDTVNDMTYLYRNGVEIWSTSQSAVNTTGSIAWVGRADNYFRGSMDQLRIYSRALSSTEINNLYTEQLIEPVNNGVFNFRTVVNGVARELQPLSNTNSNNYKLRINRVGSTLNMYYKEATVSGAYVGNWNLLDSIIASDIDMQLSLGLATFNCTASGSYFDDLLYTDGNICYPLASTPLYGTANIDNVRSDQSTQITVYDLSAADNSLYRLQNEGTYYGTNNSWSTYNYQVTPIRPFIDFITVGADPVILPANGKNTAVITALVNDQYGNPSNNKPVVFTDDNEVGFMTTSLVYTGDDYYNPGKAEAAYKAGTDITPVFIQATVTQYN